VLHSSSFSYGAFDSLPCFDYTPQNSLVDFGWKTDRVAADCCHMVQLMQLHPQTPSSLASFKSRLDLPFWYRLTQVSWKRGRYAGVVVVVVIDSQCESASRVRKTV